MSQEGEHGGRASMTTISSVAVQAGGSRITIAVLKSGSLIQLQLAESEPNMLEIGSNQEETQRLLEEHEQLMVKLKKQEDSVRCLLDEADRMVGEEAETELHEAMADSLSLAWKELVVHLEKRRELLHLAMHFFDRALEFAIKIDEAEEFYQGMSEESATGTLKELLQKHNSIKRGLLKTSLLVLNSSQELLNFLQDSGSKEELTGLARAQGACGSRAKVEHLLEILQDRRQQVDHQMRRQQLCLEAVLHVRLWEQQEQEAVKWLKEQMEAYFGSDWLGSTLSENEDLFREYRDFEKKAKDWTSLVDGLLAQAAEVISVGDSELMAARSHQLKEHQEELWRLMMNRLVDLQESNAFFSSANKAFEALAGVEKQLQALRSQPLSLPQLAQRHQELQHTSREVAAESLQRGQLLLQRIQPHCAQVAGVQRMLGYIQERVDSLNRDCHAHRDLAGKKLELMSSIEESMDKVSQWIKGTNSTLSKSMEPGSGLWQCEDMLNKHLELASQAQDVAGELKSVAEHVTQLSLLDSHEFSELSSRSSLLNEELRTVTRTLTVSLESWRSYVCFLRIAEEVDGQIQQVQEMFRDRPQEGANEEANAQAKEADSRWQSLLQRFLTVQDQANIFICSANMVSENPGLDVKAAVCQVEKIMEELTKKKAVLMDLWTSWQLQVSQMKSAKKQWKKFKEQLKRTVHDLKEVEDVLAPVSKMDLGNDLTEVTKLQDNFSLAKPQLLRLNAEVEHMVKVSELLALRGIPLKEKNEKVMELLHLHQRVKENTKKYEMVLNMAVKFLQLYNELDSVQSSAAITTLADANQARIQLAQYQQSQCHVRYLYKLSISLGSEVTNIVRQSHSLGFRVQKLQEKVEQLEKASVKWNMEANRSEEGLVSHVHYCSIKEDLHELRESYKDLKKKFNNLKFNYMKRNEKARNTKGVKNQIQQIELYAEKLQVLKKKMQAFTAKLSTITEKHLMGISLREMEDAVNELQRQLGDLDRIMEEYKLNLDLMGRLQQAMEEYQFWSGEASATIVRVGKYSSECKTKEAVSMLYKQFEKFVWPMVPQQEERIQQITDLAMRLHGPEEGKKFAEKTVMKHNEIVDSIKELCSGLMDLEAKLKAEASKQQSNPKEHDTDTEMSELKESGHTPENAGQGNEKISGVPHQQEAENHGLPDQLHHRTACPETTSYSCKEYSETSCITSISSKSTVERLERLHTSSLMETVSRSLSPSPAQPSFSDIQREFCQQENVQEKAQPPRVFREQSANTQSEVPHSAEEFMYPDASQDASLLPPTTAEGACPAEGDLLTEESFSNDEYECPSPDDISLPPLSETPESNVVQSENDLEDGMCSHSPHAGQPCHHQSHLQFSDGAPHGHGWVLRQEECRPSPPRFRVESSSFVRSPLTVPTPGLVSSTLSSILKSRLPPPPATPPSTLRECRQILYAVHESFTQTQECMHPAAPPAAPSQPSNTHASPSPLTEPGLCRPTAVQEEVRLSSGNQAALCPPGQAPNFSKLLSNATVMEGSPVTLEVEVMGSPEPTLTWYRNGQKLTNDQHIKLSQKEGKHALFIHMVANNDAGLYVARAINSSGTLSSSAVLQVKVQGRAPQFLRGLENRALLAGDDLFLECVVSGRPTPHIVWEKDGLVVASGESRLQNQSDNHVLVKRGVDSSDSGKYVCVARNEEGEAWCSAHIHVMDCALGPLEPFKLPTELPRQEDATISSVQKATV